MRIVFVVGAPYGGAVKSTHELARGMAERHHDVWVLSRRAGDSRRENLYRRSVNLRVKLEGPLGRFGRRVERFCRQVGRTMEPSEERSGYPTWTAVIPENALPALLRTAKPDVVVVCSVSRVAWRVIHDDLKRERVPAVLYVRERSSIGQLAVADPDLLMVNAKAHADAAAAVGRQCIVIPSIIDLGAARTETTRRTVLLVNPISAYGVDRAWQLARLRPDVAFVLQESWLLSPAEVAELAAKASQLGNVELRRFSADVRQVYSDAKVLLVPYADDNRPRVVAEAQVSGIPVLAAARPSLEEAVGPGGIFVPDAASEKGWARALGRLWDEPDTYAALSRVAQLHSQRAELRPARILSEFEAALHALVAHHAAEAGGGSQRA